ncbi:MAG: RNA-binding protein [Hyphomicrobiales bacterium]|nr:MAG: RNA-binding protein [Hyphomicrobiales bacterium]
MSGLLPIGFLTPWMLGALILLPVIWWLLRLTPPRPREVPFPPTRLLAEIARHEETPAHSPWWLTALRLAAAAAIILALAGPLWRPVAGGGTAGPGPLVLILDNSWAAARDWAVRIMTGERLLDAAERDGRPVVLVASADGIDQPLAATSAEEARERLAALLPRPRPALRAPLMSALADQQVDSSPGMIVWAGDGIDHGDGAQAAETLKTLAGEAPLTLIQPDGALPRALGRADNASDALTVTVLRADAARGGSGVVEARDLKGFVLGTALFSFAAGKTEAQARFSMPIELRNDIVRLDIVDENTAGAVRLIDDRWRRRTVGLVGGTARQEAQPLLSPLHYLSESLGPFADLRQAKAAVSADAIGELIDQRVSVLVLSDIGALGDPIAGRLASFVDGGGVLIRFAGPHLAAGSDDLIPVRLRSGGRVLGGSLTWEEPQPLAAFSRGGPFADLAVPTDVAVTRQVLAEPGPDLDEMTWASLADGTPLVTAARRGRGWLVLCHVTADTTWSNLPLSGVFVEMLRRTVALSAGSVAEAPASDVASEAAASGAAGPSPKTAAVLAPLRALDGYGRLGTPPADAEPIAAGDFGRITVDARHPPGFYGVADGFRALNLMPDDAVITRLDPALLGEAVVVEAYSREGPFSLAPYLFAAALTLVFLDVLAVLALGGGLSTLFRRTAAGVLVSLVALGVVAGDARAQSADTAAAIDFSATLTPRLAYVLTGNPDLDRISERGLAGLSREIAQRTALEPGAPIGIDIASDELAFYSLIYWPIDAAVDAPSSRSMGRIEAFMKGGGTVLFDTRDQLAGPVGGGMGGVSGGVSPETLKLRAILADLDVPSLEPVPLDHVLTKAFYLLQEFPGRYSGSPLWVEAMPAIDDAATAGRPVRAGDGVSPILITGNDFAAAWAVGEDGRYLYPTVPPEDYQRERALRVGINIVMYAMTGNYKADQVHIPVLLHRLGQ